MNDGGYSARNGARDAPIHKQASSGSTLGDDFPMLCETCLGPNPYVRMTKLPYGLKLCKISNLPFQAFKWKAGPGGRYKETMVCYSVAAERNICQTCLNDMKYGLPVGVRDAILSQAENQIAMPKSNVGQQYFYEQQAQMVANGQLTEHNDPSLDLANVVRSRQLDRFSRVLQVAEAKSKVAFRNLPKLCSFWLNGTCTRVLQKTCPYRPCCGVFVFPEIAGSDKELCANLVKALETEGPAVVQKNLDGATRQAISQALKGNREDAIRKRVSGEDDLTKKYLGKMKNMNLELEPPTDQSIITLWLGNIDSSISEEDIRSVIYPYGQIASLHLIRSAKCAFVEYIDREAAEYAASQLYNALMVNGRPLSVKWARPRIQTDHNNSNSSSSNGGNNNTMLPPPGLENAPMSTYILPGLPVPVLATDGGESGTWDTSNIEDNRPPPPSSSSRALDENNNSDSSNKRQKVAGNNFTPRPPTTAPPAVAVATSSAIYSHFSAYGNEEDDEEDICDKDSSDRTVTSSTTTAAAITNNNNNKLKSSSSVHYPSMNPARMGASV